MQIALAVCSILFLVIYIFLSKFIYKKFTNTNLNFSNVFPFEVWSVQHPRNMLINVFAFASGACYFSNFIINAASVNGFEVSRMIQAILAALIICCFIAILFIPLSKLKEHYTCAFLFVIGTIALSSFNLVNDFRIYSIDKNLIMLIPIIIDLAIVIVSLIYVLNPRLLDLDYVKDEKGISVRPKTFQLARTEWLTIFIFLLSQVSFIVISVI